MENIAKQHKVDRGVDKHVLQPYTKATGAEEKVADALCTKPKSLDRGIDGIAFQLYTTAAGAQGMVVEKPCKKWRSVDRGIHGAASQPYVALWVFGHSCETPERV